MKSTRRKLVIAGGSGFLGRTLAKWHLDRGADVVILSRDPDRVTRGRPSAWDGAHPGPWAKELSGSTAVINLAGRSVNCRYDARNRKLMMDSRVDSTRVLGEAIRNSENPPRVWLNSSTATIYKHTFGSPHGESGTLGATPEAKDAFSVEVATAWEEAFNREKVSPHTRKILLRTAMVFGDEPGGVYEVLRRLARFGLGGKMATGRQFVSWLHAVDFCRAIDWLIDHEDARDVYNLSAPNPVTNAEMMKEFRQSQGTPLGLPAPAFLLEIGAFFLRTETELIIKSRRVVPERLLKSGFTFEFPALKTAIENLESPPRTNGTQ